MNGVWTRRFGYTALTVVLLAVIFVWSSEQRLGPYISYAIGRLRYSDHLELGRLSMQVPNQWWIIRKASDVVELARLPPTDEEGRALLVRLEKRLIPDAVLHNPTSLKQIGDAIIEMPRASTTENVNGSNASLLEYRVSQPPERQGNLYMFWSFPKEGLTISAVDIPESYRSYLYELLKTVEWSEIGGGGRQLLDTELRQRSTKGGFCQISGLSVVSLSRRRLMLSRRLCVLMKLLKAA